jgi:hypothetical protein
MTGHNVPDHDMPNFPWSQRPVAAGVVQGEVLDALLHGNRMPGDADADLRPVAELLAALTAAPEHGELAGREEALALFRSRPGMPEPSRATAHRRPSLLTSLLNVRGAAAAAAAAVTIGGLATAAFANALPAPAQKLAHAALGAPAPHAGHGPSATPAGPDPTGPAAFGLCTAYQHAQAHGTAAQRAVAFRKLAAAAGGQAKVAAYCATVPRPGRTSRGQAVTPSPAHGKPSAKPGHPSAAPTPHPAGPPSTHPGGKPASQPTPHSSHAG